MTFGLLRTAHAVCKGGVPRITTRRTTQEASAVCKVPMAMMWTSACGIGGHAVWKAMLLMTSAQAENANWKATLLMTSALAENANWKATLLMTSAQAENANWKATLLMTSAQAENA